MEGLDSEIIAEAVSKQEAGGGIAGRIFRQVQRIVSDTRGEPGALIRVLEETQGMLGYLPLPVLKTISRDLKVPLSEIYSVASFYHFFTLAPRGKYVIQVCMGSACYVRGGEKNLNALRKELGIEPGETTPDLRFTLDTVRCVGACALAPTMVVETDVYRRVAPSQIKEILARYD
jgi:NADH:ubiquinone oxidoreductase subunit E